MDRTNETLDFNLGSVDVIPSGQGRCYVIGKQEIAIFKQRDGVLFATDNRCPHLQGSLADGLVGGGKVICPLHGRQFDLRTGAGHDDSACVRVYEVEAIDGCVRLHLREMPL